MKRIIDFLAPAGLLVALAASVAYLGGKPLPGKLEVYLIVAGALVLAHLLLRWEAVVRAIGGRQIRYGTNMIVLTLVVFSFLGGINYIASRRIVRWDLTKSQRYSLSDQTKKVVSALSEDVHITYFQRTGNPAMEEGRDRLRSYEALSKHLKLEYVDPVIKRGRVEALDVRGPWPVLVIEKAGNRERISSDNEQELTNALIKLTRSGRKTVCFVEGEGERDIDDSGETGLSEVKTALSKSLYETKKIALLREKAVPAGCTVLAITGPQADLLAPAIEAVRTYVKGGGKLLVLVEPEFKVGLPNLTALLKEWNVEAGQNVIIDMSGLGQIFGMGPLVPLAMKYPPSHEITRDFRVATAFPTARSMKAGSASLEGVTAESLAETSPDSWGESDLTLKEPVRPDQGKDTYGPLSLAVAVTVRGKVPAPTRASSPAPGEEAETPKAPEGRVVAMGDADFASNGYLGLQGNKDFFLNSVAWLAQDVDLISIRPKEADDQRMFLTGNQKLALSLIALIGLPGLCLVAGIFVWLKRR